MSTSIQPMVESSSFRPLAALAIGASQARQVVVIPDMGDTFS